MNEALVSAYTPAEQGAQVDCCRLYPGEHVIQVAESLQVAQEGRHTVQSLG